MKDMTRSEKAIITALCMVYDDNKILLQNRVKEDWHGITFPGGHIEEEEPFVQDIKREIFKETGLTIYNPQICGIKQFQTENNERYIVLLFKTNQFDGELVSSEEGGQAIKNTTLKPMAQWETSCSYSKALL